jgi:DNA polymerase
MNWLISFWTGFWTDAVNFPFRTETALPMNPKNTLTGLFDDIKNSLMYLKEKGYTALPCSEESLNVLRAWKEGAVAAPPVMPRESLEDIRNDIGDCHRCPLCEKRTHIVFGAGDPHARLVFVGEAPGHEEDQQGHPFVGEAGQLLTRIIQAINLTRDQVYICNVIKCLPPGNRNPESLEIHTCLPFLKRQIQAIGPRFICTLGKYAAQTLLKSQSPISALRGRFYDYGGIRLIPTFHPAYLLRNPDKKREVWEDMKLLMSEYGVDRG